MQRGTNKLTDDFGLFIIAKRTRRAALRAPTQALSLLLSGTHSLSLSFYMTAATNFRVQRGSFLSTKDSDSCCKQSRRREVERGDEGREERQAAHAVCEKFSSLANRGTLQFRLYPNSFSFCLVNFAFDSFFVCFNILIWSCATRRMRVFLIRTTTSSICHLCVLVLTTSPSLSPSPNLVTFRGYFPIAKNISKMAWLGPVRAGLRAVRRGEVGTEYWMGLRLCFSLFIFLALLSFALPRLVSMQVALFVFLSRLRIGFFLSWALSKHVNISIYFAGFL